MRFIKTGKSFLFTTILVSFSSVLFAQQPAQSVTFANGKFITGNNVERQLFKRQNIVEARFGEQYFLLIQFNELPTKFEQQNLAAAGIRLHSYVSGNAYLATVSDHFNFELAKSFNIISINTMPAIYKLDRQILNHHLINNTKQNEVRIGISFYPTIEKALVVEQLQQMGASIIKTKFDNATLIFIDADSAVINAIAALPFVSSIQMQSIKDQPLNYNDVGAHGISGLNALNGKNLNGSGVTIGIGDNADIATHIDFSGRLISRTPVAPSDHGTHVSGTAAGAGIINVKNHGMAPKATLINEFYSYIISKAPTYVTDNNLVVTNNSYHTVENGCPGEGKYDLLSNYADQQMKQYPQLLHVFAAGNDGANTCTPNLPGFATVKSGWQCAKNVLTVGALNTSDYSIAYFSSRGPVLDGRIKPEITAGGWAITSTKANNTYGTFYGTSMAAPVVTGALTLMYERYRQLNGGANPKSALMKALVCNTAEDLGNAGPDYTFGFGMINTRRAVQAIESNRYFINAVSNNINNNHTITVPANTKRIKIMLYWADSEGASNAAISLVNDLDIVVKDPANVMHYPLVLNATPGSENNLALEGADHVNNIEQVVIENPAAGTYTINVNGKVVPFGSQEYIVSYEIIEPSITVEYPFGGEKLVPGETENIRWNAYGDEANNFTIEYSVNNGANWNIIDNNVPAASRKYAWVIPTGISTNTALIRVSRNGSLLSDQSDFNFTVLGSPAVTATNVCAGAVQLNWSAITNATSYNILQLVGDSMQVIGNTTDVTYLIKGLDKNASVWMGVAANNGLVSGRRSISINTLANAGACTLAAFNNDITIDSILEPNTARQGFANASNALKPVKILIKNLGTTTISDPFNVSYSYLNTTVTENINPIITGGGSYVYTFNTAYPIVSTGFIYNFKSWASLAADGNHLNDTAYKTVKYINNDALTTLPITEDFESLAAASFTKAEMAIGNNNHIDFAASTARGRARTFVNTGFARSGTKAITLDQTPYSSITNADTLTFSYNLLNFNSRQIRLDFFYKKHGVNDAAGNKFWLRGSENNVWTQAFDLFADKSTDAVIFKRAVINVNEILMNAVPAQTMSSTFQFKIGQEGNTSANSPNELNDIDDGYTIDDVTLNEALNDVGVLKIISPGINGCELGAASPIVVQIKNYNAVTLNNLLVSYQINAGPIVTETIASIAPNQVMDYLFGQSANLSAYIDYNVKVWVKYGADNYSSNDSILNFVVHNNPLISSYPYLQNFELNDGYFYTKGISSSWQWGAPTKIIINKAASGSKAWVTNLTGNYNDLETSYLYSPCFNLSGLAQPMLSFSHIFSTELNYDYSWVEYTTDGVLWQKLANAGIGTNWYNNAATNKWTGKNGKWHVASIDLPVTQGTLRFRFVMSSDAGLREEGLGIDDIHVFDKAIIYTGLPVTGINKNINSSSWIDFLSGGKKVVAINANGTDLGDVTTQVHPYSGTVRNSNSQYYANRNLVVRTAKPPSANIGVRFYFTDDEAELLFNATGCSACLKPTDAYQMGITKYSGNVNDENGLLSDDVSGYFQFITPTAVVPYNNGYYAEFNVKSFSEFWLSLNNLKPASNGICPGENISFSAAGGTLNYQWQQNSGAGFININDGGYYTGTTTATLQLNNLPATFSGYKYRCLVDGIAGSENVVRFANVWNGSTSNNWFTPSNWSCGLVPDENTDVTVPGGVTNYPIVNANTAIKSISVHPGALVTLITGVVLQIKGKQ